MAQIKVLKAKSVTPELTDEKVKDGCFTTRFMTFESAIAMFKKAYGITDKEVGYKVTEQGIEICY